MHVLPRGMIYKRKECATGPANGAMMPERAKKESHV